MVVMDGIVMGPTHCAFIIVQNPFQMLMERENHFVRSMKENFITGVVFRIVKIIKLKEFKLVRNTAMTGINIDSLKQSQAWLEYVKF
jgi:hypothetical protein